MSESGMHDDLEKGFRIDEWWVLPEEGTLHREDEERRLKPQPMAVLLLLAQRGGEIVSKDEIFDSIWQQTAVEEGALPRCISEIRSALDDDARDPRYIRTLRKRGYQLLTPVENGNGRSPLSTPPPAATPPPEEFSPQAPLPRRWKRGLRVVLSIAVLYLALVTTVRVDHRLAAETEALATAPPVREGHSPVSTVAVLNVTDLSGRPETGWLAPAIQEMLTTELAVSDGLQAVTTGIVDRLERQLSAALVDAPGEPALAQLRHGLGVDYLVHGTLLVTPSGTEGGDKLRLDLKVYGDGPEIAGAVVETGTVEQLNDLIRLAGIHLRRELGVDGSQPISLRPET